MKCEAEEYTFAATRNERGDVEKGDGQEAHTVENDYLPGLKCNEQATGTIARVGDADWTRKTPGQLYEFQVVEQTLCVRGRCEGANQQRREKHA
jgi:hypothetical protein